MPTVKLYPPMKGINKNWSASSQPRFTSPDMNNVRPRSVLDNRAILGQRPGLKKAYATQLGSGSPVIAISQVSVSNETSKNKYVRKLVAASGNKIYYENASSVMTELSGATIDTSEPVVFVEAYQKVFSINGSNLDVIDFVNTKLTLTAGASTATRNDILTQAVTNAQMVVDFVNAAGTAIYGKVITGTFNATNVVSSTGTIGDFTPSAVSSNTGTVPLFYTYTIYPDIDFGGNADFGTIPTQATFGSLYRGRITLGGNKDYAHQWYMSRQAFPWDYAYFSNDAQSPVAGNDANAGELGDVGTAHIPYFDNYLVMAGAHSIWVLSGDPTSGTLRQIAFNTGIWSRESWCKGSGGNLYFLGADGIYMIDRSLSGALNLTNNVLPKYIKDWALDSTLHRVILSYDQKRHGLLICKTTITTGANEGYWFDLRVGDQTSPGGFFPESYPNSCGVFSSMFYQADDPDFNQILVGCFDGYIRTFDENTKDDDGTAISSDVLLGPFPISANNLLASKLTSQTFVTAGGGVGGTQPDTDGITYEIYVADTAEEIIEAVTATTPVPMYSVTLSGPGKSLKQRNRARGLYAGIRIKNITAAETWAIDRVVLEIKRAGKAR